MTTGYADDICRFSGSRHHCMTQRAVHLGDAHGCVTPWPAAASTITQRRRRLRSAFGGLQPSGNHGPDWLDTYSIGLTDGFNRNPQDSPQQKPQEEATMEGDRYYRFRFWFVFILRPPPIFEGMPGLTRSRPREFVGSRSILR